MKGLAITVMLACATFLAAFIGRMAWSGPRVVAPAVPALDALDSVQMAAIGIRAGPQLLVYVFGGAKCGFCQRPRTKGAIRELRPLLRSRYLKNDPYRDLTIVGVAEDHDLVAGVAYLQSLARGRLTK